MNGTIRRFTLAASVIAALALTGCGAASSSPAASFSPPPSAAPVAATSSAPAAAPSASATPSPSAAICTTHSCIVTDVQTSLVGQVADNESVITKADCFKSTVKANAGDTYTVSCDLSYSDGSVWAVLATLLVAKDQIAWEPTGQVS